jgi:hypothetical protein
MGGYQNIKGIQLYATTGTTSDYAYGVLGALGYTFEHGTAFHPPYADEVGSSWRGVMDAFLILAEAAADADTHAVVTGRVLGPNGRPANAEIRVTKRFETPLAPDAIYISETYAEKIDMSFSSGRDGRFLFHLNPSTRPELVDRKKREAYRVVVTAKGAGRATFKVFLARGERLDVGTIRL